MSHTESKCTKCQELFALLLEARDALPAITLERAKLYGVRLSLADRIEKAIEPWRLPDCTECQDFNPCPAHRTDEQLCGSAAASGEGAEVPPSVGPTATATEGPPPISTGEQS